MTPPRKLNKDENFKACFTTDNLVKCGDLFQRFIPVSTDPIVILLRFDHADHHVGSAIVLRKNILRCETMQLGDEFSCDCKSLCSIHLSKLLFFPFFHYIA